MKPPRIAPDYEKLFAVLGRHGVEYVLVGGLSAVIQGAPITTWDVDIVHRRTDDNVRRLESALAEIEATYRADSRGLRPGTSHLISPGHQLLKTTAGYLDCLGTIDAGRGYEDLVEGGQVRPVRFQGWTVLVLELEAYIGMKERAGREKDLAVLPVLRATLRALDSPGE